MFLAIKKGLGNYTYFNGSSRVNEIDVNGKIKMQKKLQIKMYKNAHKNGILLLEFEQGHILISVNM